MHTIWSIHKLNGQTHMIEHGWRELDFDWNEPNAMGPTFISRLQRLQREAPVFWSHKQQAWVVTRYDDIVQGLKDPRLSNHRMHLGLEGVRGAQSPDPLVAAVRAWIFNMDGEPHARLRRLLIRPLSKARIHQHRPAIAQILQAIAAEIESLPSVEFVSQVALRYTSTALLEVLALRELIHWEQMRAWSAAIVAALQPRTDASVLSRAEQTIQEVTQVLQEAMRRRRRHPGCDLLSDLITAADSGDQLTEADIIGLFHVLLLAGFETTAHTISLMIPVLDVSPEHRRRIREQPEQLPAMVSELQRHTAMMGVMSRLATTDFDWHGSEIRKGDLVFLMLCAGNWDELVFPDPQRLDFDRESRARPHLTFAPGLHHCLGFQLAGLQLEVALGMLFSRYERIRVLSDPPIFSNNLITRSLARLEVRFQRRGA